MSRFKSRSRSSLAAAWILLAGFAYAQPEKLAIVDAVVSDFEGGISVPAVHVFAAEDKVFFTARVVGLTPDPETKMPRAEYELEAVDCLGQVLAPPVRDALAGPQPVLKANFEVPLIPYPGVHKVRAVVRDLVSGQIARSSEEFQVASDYGDPALKLTVRRFYFHKENDTKPLESPVFLAGDSVWARFLLSGFRWSERKYDLQYGIALRNSAGRIIFNEPKAALETRESYYPRSHVNGMLSIRLERTIRPGTYTVVLTATDAIGKQQIKAEYPLTVE